MDYRDGLLVLTLTAVLALSAAHAQQTGGDLFDAIHARGRVAEARIQTIRGRFTQITVSSLLAKPLVARGTLLAAKPPRLLLTYASPERKTLLLDGNRLTVVWHDRAETEQIDVTEIMKRVNQYFTNADARQLRRAFAVTARPDPDIPNTYQLDMVPTRKQIKEGLERLQIWIDRDSLLMRQMKMSFPGGDSDTLRIDEIETNVSVDPKAFSVEIPPAKK